MTLVLLSNSLQTAVDALPMDDTPSPSPPSSSVNNNNSAPESASSSLHSASRKSRSNRHRPPSLLHIEIKAGSTATAIAMAGGGGGGSGPASSPLQASSSSSPSPSSKSVRKSKSFSHHSRKPSISSTDSSPASPNPKTLKKPRKGSKASLRYFDLEDGLTQPPPNFDRLASLPLGVLQHYIFQKISLQQAARLRTTSRYFFNADIFPFARYHTALDLVKSLNDDKDNALTRRLESRIKEHVQEAPFLSITTESSDILFQAEAKKG